MSYMSRDEQTLLKIKKYLNKLEMLYDSISKQSDEEIDDGIEGLALTQCVTNLFELSVRIDNEAISQKLSILSSNKTARLRNISSHDYDAVNWSIAKKNCGLILAAVTPDVLQECSDIIEKEKSCTRDYTSNELHAFETKSRK